MEPSIRILYLEDDQNDVELLQVKLEESGLTCQVTVVQTRDEFEQALQLDEYDIILADYQLPMYDGMSALRLVRELHPDVPFVFVSGTMGEETAIEALKQGATDYVLKHNMVRLAPAIQRALQEARNLRERKQAQDDLQHSNDMLRAIIEAAPTAVIGLDLEGNVHSIWNKAAEKMLGWSAREVMGRPLPSVPVDSQEEFRGFREQIRAGLILDGVDVSRQRRDGTPIDYSIYASPLHDIDGQITGNIAILVDITERKRAEYERISSLKFFESMDKVNQAIQGASDLDNMMKDLLDIVLSTFDCDRAFLLYPCDPESPTWTIPMERNKPEYPGMRDLILDVPTDSQVAETQRIILATEGPVILGPDMPHKIPEGLSKQFNVKSAMAMAVYPKTDSPWQFGIHQCSHAHVWTAEEKQIFEAIGRRLADSLGNLLSYRDLQESEKFLNSIVDNIPNMIFVKDAKDLRFVRFNKAGEDLLGYSEKEMLGKNDYDFFSKEEADFFTDMDRKVLNSMELFDIPEETILTRNNEELILHTKKIPILDDTGAPQYLLGISDDITERKQADESLLKLSQAIEQSPVSIVITDTEGTIEFVNTKFTNITGYTYDEAIGQNPRILKSGETSVEEYRKLWETISSGGVWEGEFQNRNKNGKLFWERAIISPVRNADNVITHYVGVKEDITEYRKLEEQIRQTQKMEAIGQLAGGVAHDFNNMLGVIIGHAELVLEKPALDDSLREDLDEIRMAGLRSAEITKKLLALARKQTISPRILDLNTTVEMMLKLLRRLIGEEIDLVWVPGMNLWSIQVDPAQIDQILANLFINARDAIVGVGKVTIETHNVDFDEAYCAEHKELSPGEYVELVVSDNGSGMNKETMDKIFEPFFTTKGKSEGTGLGLSTVYGIVKQNAGFINVYSEPGYGSTFKIYLPRHADKGEHVPKESLAAPIIQGSETILLVEDDSLVLKTSKKMLEVFGYAVLTSSTPKEAIHLANEYSGEIDMLIIDMVLPEMTGPDLEEKIKTLYPELKSLFMSGYTGKIITHPGGLDESVHFIQKPFTMHQLAAKVREVLDSK